MKVIDTLQKQWQLRPWWMNLLLGFCLYMTFIYMPFDIFYKPVAEDEEVWFGFVLHGWYAKLTEPLHWLIYGAGAYGFWHMKSWMWPWAGVYAAQVVIAMVVFAFVDQRGGGWTVALIAGAIFMVPCLALFRAREQFQGRPSAGPANVGPANAGPPNEVIQEP